MDKTTSIPPFSLARDQKVNLSYIKRLECEFLYCYKLMLRLYQFSLPLKRLKGKICYILDSYSERLLDLV